MEKKFIYIPKNVCSREMNLIIDGNIIKNVQIVGGCSGNTQGICKLVKNRKIDEVIKLLKDINCNGRGTSCPDQLAIALLKIKNGELKSTNE